MGTSFDPPSSQRAIPLTLYTELMVLRGTIQTTQHRVTDILNEAADSHLILDHVTLQEYGSTGPPVRSEFAQVNLGSVLFAVSLTALKPINELRRPKIVERALLSVPPFRIVGQVHLLPGRSLRDSLDELHGTFIPVTDATFWSSWVGEARRTVAFAGVNRARAQVFAPIREVDPWAGADPVTDRADEATDRADEATDRADEPEPPTAG